MNEYFRPSFINTYPSGKLFSFCISSLMAWFLFSNSLFFSFAIIDCKVTSFFLYSMQNSEMLSPDKEKNLKAAGMIVCQRLHCFSSYTLFIYIKGNTHKYR